MPGSRVFNALDTGYRIKSGTGFAGMTTHQRFLRLLKELIIWRFSDGKPGHDHQSVGLVTALQVQRAIVEYRLDVSVPGRPAWWWLSGRYPPGEALPRPDILLGAGHASHVHMLAARRRFGGRCVVLMTPGLPRTWFDLCIVPEHDGVRPAANQLITRGVLNHVRPGGEHDSETGLIAIGGPSRHYRWDDDSLCQQLEQLLRLRPKRRWWLTSSRRTPAALVSRLAGLPGVEFMPFAETPSGWLLERLAEAGEVRVSEDSVSMIYEALSSGARVGLLEVHRQCSNRITRGVDQLISDSWVGAPGQMRLAAGPKQVLNEADRCAKWIDKQWLSAH